MKKLMLLAASGLMIAGLTSCEKDFTCSCTTTYDETASDPAYEAYTWPGYTATASVNGKKKKKESEEWCASYETTASSSYTDTEYDYDYVTGVSTEKVITYTESSVTKCALK